MIVVADTSGLIASVDRKLDSSEREACRHVLSEASTVVVSPLVLAEVDHVASQRFGLKERDVLVGFIVAQVRRMRFQMPELDADKLEAALAIRSRYGQLQLDLADCVNAVLAADYRTDAILTLDQRDFRAIKPLTGSPAFRILPFDR
ncbi:putative nucleic acid-binding protein [Nonomuraea polychroma]|uniref:Ribonuclease VapC n=1 Tax=Nonomuraea polychroma TaxID=46176 RepID=A0A438MCQ0_9ACTN|nr:PIN domain-containing protein [Nonomuraea polychroma]RVX43496.1 putative nucleic acid-binding protein [Nonomuraea polychroma]